MDDSVLESCAGGARPGWGEGSYLRHEVSDGIAALSYPNSRMVMFERALCSIRP